MGVLTVDVKYHTKIAHLFGESMVPFLYKTVHPFNHYYTSTGVISSTLMY